MKKISLLAVAISLALTGCGGSDENGSSTTTSSTTSSTTKSAKNTVKVIDGYLVNAEVYVDRNDNGKPESDEKLDGLTNTRGEITLDNSDTQYGLIIRAIAGKAYDQDKVGRLTKTIELSADAGTTIVTPFTTAAKAQNMSVSDLAASLNLPEAVIAGDYTASDSDSAIQAHLYARSIARSLTDNSASLSATSVESAISKVDTAIKNIPDGTDLATKYVDSSGTVQNMQPTVKSFLVDHTYYLASTNKSYFAGDLSKNGNAVPTVSFKADKFKMGGESYSIEYGDNGFYMTENGQTGHEEFVFSGDNLGLAFTAQNDLNLYTQENISAGFTAISATNEMFSGQTFYHIFDNSTNSDPQPAYVTFIFSKYSVTIKEDNKPDRKASWTASGTILTIFHADDEDNTWHIRPVFNEDSMIVAYEGRNSKTIPRFFIKDKDMADNIYAQWNTRVSE